MSYNVNDSDGAQALDYNQQADRFQFSVASGCAVSIDSGTLGQADTLALASGDVIHDGNTVSVASQSVQIDGANASNPRKDVVYLDSNGDAQVANGTPEAAEPSTATRFETFRPAPLDLSATKAVVVAEVWVPAGASSITSADVRDRRVFADAAFRNTTHESLNTAEADITDRWDFEPGYRHPVDRIAETDKYKIGPKPLRLNNGDILVFYREGPNGDHGGSTDGRSVCRRSADYGETWGSIIEVADDANYDVKSPTPAYDSETGKITVLLRYKDGGDADDIYQVQSTDNGESWTSPTQIDPTSNTSIAPIGRGVATSNGLAIPIQCNDGDGNTVIEIVFSTDGGDTWGSPSTAINQTDVGHAISEPLLCRIDDDRILLTLRDDRRDSTKTGDNLIVRSSDGGATWESTIYRTNPFDQGGCMWLWCERTSPSTVTVVQSTRTDGSGVGGPGTLYGASISSDLFWDDPSSLDTAADIKTVWESQGSDASAWGYASLLSMGPQLEDTLAFWGDDANDDGGSDIFAGSFAGGASNAGKPTQSGTASISGPSASSDGSWDTNEANTTMVSFPSSFDSAPIVVISSGAGSGLMFGRDSVDTDGFRVIARNYSTEDLSSDTFDLGWVAIGQS